MFRNRITVFTPTYNRAYIINNLYQSLTKQLYKNFEWLVVDDGSTDNTSKLFDELMQNEEQFSIRYYRQENGGKHRAVNYGLDLAQGEIFFVVDSDDQLTPDALEKINSWFEQIGNDPNIKGIVANKGYSATQTVNYYFDAPYLDKTFLDIWHYEEHGQNVLRGERAIAFYTDFHRKYKYPEFNGEKFMTEAVVYNRMAHDGYKMRFYNDIIWIFEYQDDGLSANGSEIYLKNPHGYGLWLKERADFLQIDLLERLKMYYSFYCDLIGRCSVKEIAECIEASMWIIKLSGILYKMKHR